MKQKVFWENEQVDRKKENGDIMTLPQWMLHKECRLVIQRPLQYRLIGDCLYSDYCAYGCWMAENKDWLYIDTFSVDKISLYI